MFWTTSSKFAVSRSAEWHRIDSLPRRIWTHESASEVARRLTAVLRTPCGERTLLPVQAQALLEAAQFRGAYCALVVGDGKTDITYNLPRVMKAYCPVLLAPAKHIEPRANKTGARSKTATEFAYLSTQWAGAPWAEDRFVSYEVLGRETGKTLLDRLAPDLLVCDESHKLKDRRSAVTRRVRRWRLAHPEVPMVCLTGSTVKDSIKNYAHLLWWTLGGGSPTPIASIDRDEWAAALDEVANYLGIPRPTPDPLLEWATPEERETLTDLDAARAGVGRRLVQTPGFIASLPGDGACRATLHLTAVRPTHPPEVREALRNLRSKWVLPDDTECLEATEIWRHARTLSKGFFLHWKEPPPPDWLSARRACFSLIRGKLLRSRTLDSPDDAMKTLADHPEVRRWLEVRGDFRPKTEAVWLSDHVLKLCAEWLADAGVVWVENPGFGGALEQLTGTPYFGQGGITTTGRSIVDYTGASAICSIRAVGEGFNCLTRFQRHLVTNPPANNPAWEQLLGRGHRRGQTAAEVRYEVLIGCPEHSEGLQTAIAQAHMSHLTLTTKPKLLIAHIDL